MKGTISPPIVCLDRLLGDDVGARRTGHQIPCLVGKECSVLLFHRAVLVRVRQGVANGRGYRRDLWVAGHRRESSGPQGTSRVSHHHRVNVMRVSVKECWVVHRRHDTGSRGPRRRSWRRRRRRGHRWWRHRRRRRDHRG